MEKPAAIPGEGAEIVRLASEAEKDPVLLALPGRLLESLPASAGESDDPCLDQLQVIETGCGPQVETGLLIDLLARGFRQGLTDPVEVHNYHNPLASVNAYKHRLHALRCEYVAARLRIYDLETQLNQARCRVEALEKQVRSLDATLQQMRASRSWKLVETCSQWRRFVSGWLAVRMQDRSKRT